MDAAPAVRPEALPPAAVVVAALAAAAAVAGPLALSLQPRLSQALLAVAQRLPAAQVCNVLAASGQAGSAPVPTGTPPSLLRLLAG